MVPVPDPDPDYAVAWTLAGRPDPGGFEPDPVLRRLARTVRVTSEWYGVDPMTIARIVRVESAADSAARHPPITVRVGPRLVRTRAVGLGGIVPEFWLGLYPECGDDLRRVRDNVCYTVRIWRHYRDRSDTAREAALAYNGCRSDHCRWYASAILDD